MGHSNDDLVLEASVLFAETTGFIQKGMGIYRIGISSKTENTLYVLLLTECSDSCFYLMPFNKSSD